MAFGSGSQDKIQIVVEIDSKDAVKVLGQFGDQVKRVGDNAKTASKDTNEFFAGVTKGAIAALGAYVSFQTAFKAIDIGSQVSDVENAFNRLTSQIGVSADELQNRFSEALGGTLSAFETTRKANELLVAGINPDKFDELAQTARALADTLGTDTAQALDQVSDSLLRGNDRALKAIGVHVDFTKAQEDFARSIGTTSDMLNEAGRLEANRIAIMAEAETQLVKLGRVENDSADNLARLSANLVNVRNQMAQVISENPELNRLLKELAEIDFSGLTESFKGFVSVVAESASIIKNSLGWLLDEQGLKDGVAALGYMMKGADMNTASALAAADRYKQSITTISAAQGALVGIIEKEEKATKKTVAAKGGYIDANKKAQKSAEDLSKVALKNLDRAIDKSTENLKAAEAELKNIEEALNAVKQAAQDMANAAPVLSQVFGGLGIGNSDLSISIAGSMEAALAEGISLALSGAGTSEDYKATATQLGGEIGTAIGGPVIGAFAEQLTNDIVNIGNSSRESFRGVASAMFGPVVGSIADSMFGDSFADSAGTALKKSLDKIIGDAYKDLTFSGNQDPTKGLFAGLGEQAQEQFKIAGDALTTFLGGSTDLGVNLGVVLANNNVHLAELSSIIESVGGSFESLSETMYLAFYEGEMSVLALQDQLEELYGIINGTSTFQDLGDAARSALSEDGRILLAAIKAIGAEAEQLGISTFPQMANVLVNQFGLAADQVQAILASISAAGVNSINALANAGQNVTTAIGANLEQVALGQTPTNTPVGAAPTAPAKTGGSPSRSSSKAPAKSKENKIEKARREIEQLYNLVDRSQQAKDLQDKISKGLINDAQYADGISSLMEQAKILQKAVNKEEKEFLDAQRKDSKDKGKQLQEFEKAKRDLANLLGKEQEKLFSINSPLLDFIKEFRGQTDLLNLAAQAAGTSFQQIQENAMQAFLSGKQTFAQAKASIDELTGGKDAKNQLDKFISLGTSGGALSIDAFQKIGKAIQNAGGTSLDSLSEQFLGSGADRETVQKFFIALQNSGIDSLDEIANASTETVITIGNQLQDLKFPFSETQSETSKILSQLDQIRNSNVTAKINLSVDMSAEDRDLLLSYGIIKEGDLQGIGQVNAGTTYADTSLGLTKQGARAEYRRLKKLGKLKKAENYKARYASYF